MCFNLKLSENGCLDYENNNRNKKKKESKLYIINLMYIEYIK